MNGKAIIYPYWENVARGYEDILALITFFEALFLLYTVGVAVGLFAYWWKHKGWTLREKRLILQDKAERFVERRRERRPGKKKYTGEISDLEVLDLEEVPEEAGGRNFRSAGAEIRTGSREEIKMPGKQGIRITR